MRLESENLLTGSHPLEREVSPVNRVHILQANEPMTSNSKASSSAVKRRKYQLTPIQYCGDAQPQTFQAWTLYQEPPHILTARENIAERSLFCTVNGQGVVMLDSDPAEKKTTY